MSVKKFMYVKKIMFRILVNDLWKWKFLASIMYDSMITFDEVIKSYDEETKIISTNFDEKKVTFKTQSFYVSIAFLLIIMALLIAVRIW